MILAIDQGTTGTTCFVFDERAEPIGRAQREFTQHFPQPGWVEHDAGEIWSVTHAVAGEALEDAGVRPGELAAVGIANQRETVCVWDPATGEPLHNAIVWQDRRTAARCEELRAAGHEPLIRERTGLILDPYFSATKIAWLLENVDGLRERVRDGTAVFGTIDSWLIFKLTGEHVTDATNASRTLLYDIAAGRWDPELLDLFDVPVGALAQVRPSAGILGETRPAALHGHAVPIAGVAGDQQAALFGQACVDPGMAKATFGTGSFVLLHSGFTVPDRVPATRSARDGRFERIGAKGEPTRSRRRSSSPARRCSGCATSSRSSSAPRRPRRWRRRSTQTTASTSCRRSPASARRTGIPHARGTIVGLTRGTGRAHLARATLEAIAYQTLDAVRAMQEVTARPLGELRADGGASANSWLMQFQADVLGAPVVLGESTETTALGAAYLAGVGVGLWTVSDVRDSWREGARYEPRMGEDERAALLAGWDDALDARA